jgi:hypothetical protein
VQDLQSIPIGPMAAIRVMIAGAHQVLSSSRHAATEIANLSVAFGPVWAKDLAGSID